MTTVVLSIEYEFEGEYPDRTMVDHIEVQLSGTLGYHVVQNILPLTDQVKFENLVDDTYTYVLRAIDPTAAPLSAFSGTFKVPSPAMISLNIPRGVKVIQA